ncbi:MULTISPECIES: hypothetical protein [Streptomyces]|uniref:Translation initiation factor IF-2 n=1 Tax=Streptomyces sudanensis TaxID=436397 RepID=A0ABY4TB54_9ACTN|nr:MULTISPECIES: hypothetical protein [Streptomyces]URN15448.1 hypothetical protein MW084_05220 [Streptomyces sudanensis]
MPEDFITKVELTEALATHGIDGATKDVTTSAEVDAKIKAALDAQKAPEPAKPAEPPKKEETEPPKKKEEEELINDWKWWVPTELNLVKSEFTAFKAEWVPILLTLPAVFSLDEFLKEKYNLEYRKGVLRRKRPTETTNEDPPPPADPANPDEQPSDPRGGGTPPGGGTPDDPEPRRTAPDDPEPRRTTPDDPARSRPGGSDGPDGSDGATPRGRERRRARRRRQREENQAGSTGGGRTPPTTPRPPSDPVAPVTRAASQGRPEVRGATDDLDALRRGLDDTSRAADGG